MLWQKIIERALTYIFIILILIIASKTVILINDNNKILKVKGEIIQELSKDNERLRERMIRLEIKQDDKSISQGKRFDSLESRDDLLFSRLNALEETITKINNNSNE